MEKRPSSPESSSDSYRELLGINRRAFAAGRFEVAYHSLAAALHAARDGSEMLQVRNVGRIAAEQASAIASEGQQLRDASVPRRGNVKLYDNLVLQSDATARILELRERTDSRPGATRLGNSPA
jgi:hypothetical protein